MREYIAVFNDDNSRNHAISNTEIIRCKDCKWYDNDNKGCVSEIGLVEAFPEDFCSYGKRREK